LDAAAQPKPFWALEKPVLAAPIRPVWSPETRRKPTGALLDNFNLR
jgi:hypothetical protein